MPVYARLNRAEWELGGELGPTVDTAGDSDEKMVGRGVAKLR